MNLGRITALIYRHLFLYRRSFPRLLEIFYWPLLDLVVWGFITMYLAQEGKELHGAVVFFLGALIFWDILFRAQQGITISFLEEIWSRNLMNLFASPLTAGEFLAAMMAMSIFKVAAVSIIMAFAALFFYSYNVFIMGLTLDPIHPEPDCLRVVHRDLNHVGDYAIRPASRSPRLGVGLSVPTDLLRVLSAVRVAELAATVRPGESGRARV